MKSFLKNLLCGFTMGVVSVIPGISGGTMALITGVFDKIIDAMRQLTSKRAATLLRHRRFKELRATLPWLFLAALGGGIFIGTAATANLVLYLRDNHQPPTYAFFLGLVIASLLPVARRVHCWNKTRMVSLVAGIAIGFAFVFLTRERVATPDDWWMLPIVGAITACAMILPGLSGSFILIVLDKYEMMWGAFGRLTSIKNWASGNITTNDFFTLALIGIGGALGLAAFSHLLFYLLKRHNDTTLSLLTGLMIGSLWKLWPWQVEIEKIGDTTLATNVWPWHYDSPVTVWGFLLVLVLFFLGGLCVWVVERFAGGREKQTSCKPAGLP